MRALAAEIRVEMGIGSFDRLDPYRIAEEYRVPVYPLQELGDHRGQCSEAAIAHFTVTRRTKWSAALVAAGSNRMIIENAAHEEVRRRSNLAHEISHLLLEHEFDTLLLTDDTTCFTDEKKEKEAQFLARELLISEQAAKQAAFKRLTNEEVGALYDVSSQFAQWRMSGPRVYAQRSLARQNGTS
ncbi:hypothetical protein ThrDRAFT_02580 [Frankia casuarinae]|jgi:Zn-dependent peptidase ImmA (M78 family)|nr:ImmA/IrrE family metallo-endopeptidase [Frankia casuarinae]EYT91815.1 hypothetical protein ThrDRAFT_02580 [Frankia casuarinae]